MSNESLANYRVGNQIRLEFTITHNSMRFKEYVYGNFVSYNPLSATNKIESVTIERILNLHEHLNGAEPIMQNQTISLAVRGLQLGIGFRWEN